MVKDVSTNFSNWLFIRDSSEKFDILIVLSLTPVLISLSKNYLDVFNSLSQTCTWPIRLLFSWFGC